MDARANVFYSHPYTPGATMGCIRPWLKTIVSNLNEYALAWLNGISLKYVAQSTKFRTNEIGYVSNISIIVPCPLLLSE